MSENEIIKVDLTDEQLDQEISDQEIEVTMDEQQKQIINEWGKVNVIFAGKSGVGKSTLINALFRKDLADVGIGKPVTDHLEVMDGGNLPVMIYDTKGLELNPKVQEEVKQEIDACIDERGASDNPAEHINCLCWVIDANAQGVDDVELKNIKYFAQKLPVFIVLSKAYDKTKADKFRQELVQSDLEVQNIIPVCSAPYDEFNCESYGLNELIEAIMTILPEMKQNAWASAVKNALQVKQAAANKAISAAVGSAALTGAAPIRGSDAPFLVGIETALLISLSKIYGIDVTKSTAISLVKDVLLSGGATFVGKTIVANVLKLVPGPGTFLAAVISGVTAGTITAGIGYAYRLVLDEVEMGEIPADMIESNFMGIFSKLNLKEIFKQFNK